MALPNITTANFNAASSNLDLLPHNIEAPIKKLDADNYMAEDIDGVTESLFGSGNMNFLSLQSGQTDAAIDNAAIGSDSNALNGLEFNTNSSAFSNQTNTPDNFSSLNAGGSSNPNDILSSIGDRFADNTTQIDIGNPVSNESNFVGSTLGSISASALSTNTGTNGIPLGGPSQSGQDGLNGNDGNNGDNGNNGSNGTNGENGHHGGGGDTTIINVDFGDIINLGDTLNIDVDDILQQINVTLTTVTNLVETLISTVSTIDIIDVSSLLEQILQLTENVVTNVTNNITEILTETVTQIDVTNIVTDLVETTLNIKHVLIEKLDLSNLTDNLGDIVDIKLALIDNLVGDVVTHLGDITNLTHDLSETLLGSLLNGDNNGGMDSDILLGLDTNIDALDPVIETLDHLGDIVLDPIEDLLGDVDLGVDVGLDLFDTDNIANDQGDTDITLNTDLDLIDSDILNIDIDIPLDPLEAIIGDVDIDLGAATDILGDTADALLNAGQGGTGEENILTAVNDVVEGIVDTVLNTDDNPQDTDLDLDLDVNLLGNDVVDLDLVDIPLDPVEDILGDIDIELDVALDLLSLNTTPSDVLADDGIIGWTENLLGTDNNLFGDLVSGLGGDFDALPDPVGTIAEGLGVLDVQPDVDVNLLGGLFG
ncbi:MAG: hypothetical protein CMH30_06100 [Micavibrio sp.]|nr:hypothetical protein [Micavibrio sp.]|tara:strand:- start:1685 stop:3643 length:1959 start_codon:yes stop_codon:yes gene_type:complete